MGAFSLMNMVEFGKSIPNSSTSGKYNFIKTSNKSNNGDGIPNPRWMNECLPTFFSPCIYHKFTDVISQIHRCNIANLMINRFNFSQKLPDLLSESGHSFVQFLLPTYSVH